VTEVLTPKLAKGMIAKLEELADTVQGGMSGLVAATAAASGATVHLGAPVLSVRAGPDGVSATLTDGRVLAARAAIVAVPVNTLGQIRFDPPLSAPQQALAERGHAGRAVKLLIRARGVAPGSLATGETAGLRWIYADHILPDGATLLIGFALARDLPAPSEGMVARALAAAFPEARFEGFDWHDWIADPYARGTWVSPDIDSLPLYDPTHWTGSPRLAFAGSDHSSAEQGWFEGALLTAEAAVARLDLTLFETEPAL
jgi:monoamine oxidase